MGSLKLSAGVLAALALVLAAGAAPARAGLPSEEVPVSEPAREGVPKSVLPQSLSAPGAYEGVIAPSGLRRYDWQADLVFFSDSYSGFPALAVSGQKEGKGFLLLYSDSRLPNVRSRGAFLRAAGLPVKSVTTSVLIAGVSTATYTADLVDRFDTRAQVFTLFYYSRFYENDFMRAGVLLGLPFAWHDYAVSGTLESGARFSQRGHAFGLGLVPGLTASLSSASLLNRGLACSLFLLYERFGFEDADGRAGRRMRGRLDGLRFGFSGGWRFNFYR